MNKVNFLTSLPLKQMSGKEKITALVYCLVKGKEKNFTNLSNLKKQWPKTQFKIEFNSNQLYNSQGEDWIVNENGEIKITDKGIKHIQNLQKPIIQKRTKNNGYPIFSTELTNKLKKEFKVELEDFAHNFGCSGTCTAFLLRKILEKLIYLVFAKNNMKGLEDKSKLGNLVGLKKMLEVSSKQKALKKLIISLLCYQKL